MPKIFLFAALLAVCIVPACAAAGSGPPAEEFAHEYRGLPFSLEIRKSSPDEIREGRVPLTAVLTNRAEESVTFAFDMGPDEWICAGLEGYAVSNLLPQEFTLAPGDSLSNPLVIHLAAPLSFDAQIQIGFQAAGARSPVWSSPFSLRSLGFNQHGRIEG